MAVSSRDPSGDAQVSSSAPRSHVINQPELSGSDRFLEVGGKALGTIVEHRVPVLVTLTGAFAIAFAVAGWDWYQDRRNLEGIEQLERAIAKGPADDAASLASGITLDAPGSSPEDLAKKNDQYQAVAATLETVARNYSGLTSGVLATLERARILEKVGDRDAAAATYQAAASQVKEPMFLFRALNGHASILRDQSRHDEAVQQYQRIVAELGGVWRLQGLLELGRTYELAGRTTDAVSTYELALKNFPDAELIRSAEERLAALKSGVSGATATDPAPSASSPALAVPAEPNATGAASESSQAAPGTGGPE